MEKPTIKIKQGAILKILLFIIIGAAVYAALPSYP